MRQDIRWQIEMAKWLKRRIAPPPRMGIQSFLYSNKIVFLINFN